MEKTSNKLVDLSDKIFCMISAPERLGKIGSKLVLGVLFLLFAVNIFAGEVDEVSDSGNGIISGCKFTPLQLGWGFEGWDSLFDKDADTVFTLGIWHIEQKSAVFSLCGWSELDCNYGVQISPGIAHARRNYGISLAQESWCKENYGVQIGLFNGIGKAEKVNVCGVNIADFIQIGVANLNQEVQIGGLNIADLYKSGYFQCGLFNVGSYGVQIGLLNYNPGSYIPWMILFNFAMKPAEK